MKTLAILLALLGAGALFAQEPKVWVHAPAEDLLGLYADKGAGYLISIEEYRTLVGLARRTERAAAERPPLEANLVHGLATGRLDGDLLKIQATYTAVVTGKRPAEVPFPLHGAALEAIDVEDGEYVDGALRFAGAGTYNVTAALSVVLEKTGELRRAAFRLPAAAGHTLAIDMPPGMEGEVGPIVRAFKTGNAREAVVGYPDHNGVFSLWIRPRAEARRLDPLLSVTFDTVAALGEARTVTRTDLSVEVLRAPVTGLDLVLARGQTIRALSGKQIKTWRVEKGNDFDTLKITFVEPVQGTQQIQVEAELPRDNALVEIPVVRVPRAIRYRGTVGLVRQPEVRVTSIEAEGARRLDKLPKGLVSLHEVYGANPKITATVERIASKTRAFTRAMLVFAEEGKKLRAQFLYTIAGKPLFRLEPSLPAGWILRTARLDGVPVDHRYEDNGKLVMVFPQGLKPGRHVLEVALDTDEVDWVPNEGAANVAFSGLRCGLDEETGYFVVASDPAFRVSTGETQGLHKVGMPEVEATGIAIGKQVLYAWRFDAPQYSAGFRLERHRPQISVQVINRVYPSERVLKSHATLLFKIERTGVRELKVRVPRGTGPLVDFQGALIKEKRQPQEGAEDEDGEVWTIVFQKRIRGLYRLDAVFDRKFEQDAWTAPVPAVAVPDAEEHGFVVVHSSATTAIDVERNGLREADVGELPEVPKRPPLEVLAYAKQPFTVTISSKRHDPHAVIQAVALRADIYGVLTSDGRLRVRAEYRVRNNDQAFLAYTLPEGSTLIGALVDGEPVKPLVDARQPKLPLARSKDRTAPFQVALIYESVIEALDDSGNVTIARPTLNIDVLQTRYTLHLPAGYALTGHDGDLVPMNTRESKTVFDALVPKLFPLVFTAGSVDSLAPAGDAGAGAPSVHAIEQDPTRAAKPAPKSKRPEAAKAPPKAGERRSRKARETLRDREQSKAEKKNADKMLDDAPAEEPAESADADMEELQEVEEEVDGDGSADMKGLGGKRVARGGRPKPTAGGGDAGPAPRRKRPERALLSLDVQFLRPDNVYTLDSLAPTGTVTLAYARERVFSTRHYLGVVIGAALGLLALVATFSLRRLAAVIVLGIAALHFGGLSFLSADFAIGAATALLVALVIAAIPRLVRALLSIRLPRRKAAAGGVLLLATFAQAQEEVLVPYSGGDMDKIERVFLPATEYHRLRKLAYPDAVERSTAFAAAAYDVALSGEELTVAVTYRIVKESAASERIPLRLNGLAIDSATLDGKPATLEIEKDGYVLVLSGRGRFVLDLRLRPKLEGSGDRRWFRIPVRPVANATMKVTHDRRGHEAEPIRLGDGSHIGPVQTVGVTWTPKTEGFRAAAAELRAQTDTVVSVRDGYTAIATRIGYGIAGGTADRFRVRVDKSLRVRSVLCQDLAGWERDSEGVVTIALTKPATNQHVIELRAERQASRAREESFPEIAPMDVVRDAGVVAIETLADLKVEVLQAQGLLRGRADQAPQKLSAAHDAGAVHSVHRFAVRPFTLRWRVFLEQTRMRAETDLDVRVGRQAVNALATLTVHVERGPGPYLLRMAVPEGYEVKSARGALRDWWVADKILHLARSTRQSGKESYAVWLQRTTDTTQAFDAPAVTVQDAARESGLVRVSVADGLELDAREAANLMPEDIAKVPPVSPEHLRRAYRYVTTPWRLVLTTREETREMEALVVSRVVPLADRMRVEALVNFYVRRGLVDELSFVVPLEDGAAPVVTADDLREELSAAVEGGRRYTLRLRTPTRGTVSAVVTYTLPYGASLRGVEPLGAARVQRYVAVEKVADGEVKLAGPQNLEAGDFDDLPLAPPGTTAQSVAGVYVGIGGPFGLDVSVKRHTFEAVEKAVIHSAAANVVVDRSGWTRALLTYRVYNRSEQFLELTLPAGATLYSVFVAGEGVRPLVHEGRLLVPLRKVAVGAPTFDVDVVYAYRGPKMGDDDFEVRLPDVDRLEVRRTTLSVWVPKGYSYDFEGEMEPVEQADITVKKADDIYQEIKDLYGIAERGNKLQADRALANVKQLENQVRRLADEVQSETRSEATREQVEIQKRKLDQLRELASENKKGPAKQQAGQWGADDEKLQAKDWGVNAGYLKRNLRADNEHLEDFKRKQQQQQDGGDIRGRPENSFRGPSGGVPPGMRDPNDPDGPPPSPADAPFSGPTTNTAIGMGGGAGGGSGAKADGVFRDAELLEKNIEGVIRAGQKVPTFAADFDVELAQGAFIGDPVIGKLGLQGATGRISIKIDLPLEGEVYHFHSLGKELGVTFAASEDGGSVFLGLLAVLCAGVAVLLVRGGRYR